MRFYRAIARGFLSRVRALLYFGKHQPLDKPNLGPLHLCLKLIAVEISKTRSSLRAEAFKWPWGVMQFKAYSRKIMTIRMNGYSKSPVKAGKLPRKPTLRAWRSQGAPTGTVFKLTDPSRYSLGGDVDVSSRGLLRAVSLLRLQPEPKSGSVSFCSGNSRRQTSDKALPSLIGRAQRSHQSRKTGFSRFDVAGRPGIHRGLQAHREAP